jgi:hypothetical protein
MNQPGELGRWNPLLARVKDLGADMARRTDAELRSLRDVLSERLVGNQAPEPAMAEAFSAVLEAARRAAGHSYADSDVIAGAALYSGQAVQVKDDGCNHFVALLPGYLYALQHKSVHYVTATAALAQRSLQDVEGLGAALGLRTRLLPGNQVSREDPGPAAESDLTYASYQKLAVEYLGEHLAPGDPGAAFRKERIAIAYPIDTILIDQANLPLLISAPKSSDADHYHFGCPDCYQPRRQAGWFSPAPGGDSPGGRGKGRTGDIPGTGCAGADNGEWLFPYLCKAMRPLWCRRSSSLRNGEHLRTDHGSGTEGRTSKSCRPPRPELREGAAQVYGTGRGRVAQAQDRPAGGDRHPDFGGQHPGEPALDGSGKFRTARCCRATRRSPRTS